MTALTEAHDEPLRWGVVATGSISAAVTADLQRTPGCSVVAVGSRTQESARAFADRFAIPRAHSSYGDLVADPDVDVVYIGTTHDRHHDVALAAIDAGKAVLCEKPFTVTAAQAQEVVAAARARGTFLMEAMWMRCLPAFRRLRGLLDDGAVGEVRALRAALGFVAGPEHPVRLTDPVLAGGALLDMGVYPLTFAYALLGGPSQVRAVGRVEGGVDVGTAIALAWADGAVAALETSLTAQLRNSAVVSGTTGWIEVPPAFHMSSTFTVHRDGAEPEVVQAPHDGSGYAHECAEVVACVRTGLTESSLVPLDDTLGVMALLDEVRAQIGLHYPVAAR